MIRRGYLWGFLALYSFVYFQACLAVTTLPQHEHPNQQWSQKSTHSDMVKAEDVDRSWIEKMVDQPLFSTNHRPLTPAALAYPNLSLCRLSAILINLRHRAIILVLPDDKSVVLSEGDLIGSALVTSVTPFEAYFKQSGKSFVLRPKAAVQKRIIVEAKDPGGGYSSRRLRSKEIGDPYFLTLVRPTPSGHLYCDPSAEQVCAE